MCVATSTAIAIGVGAAGAASSIASAKIQSNAAKNAAKTQTDAATQARNVQQQQYQQARQDFNPYQQAGIGSLGRLNASAGAPRQAFNPGAPSGGFQMPQNPGSAPPGGATPGPAMPQQPPVMMQGPDGSRRPVPANLVQQFEERGARRV